MGQKPITTVKENNMKAKALSVATVLALTLDMTAAHAVTSCGGQSSPGNPFPCCSNGGNCTWWAYKKATETGKWNVTPMGNAHTWVAAARKSPAYLVSKEPVANSVGVKESAPPSGCKANDRSCDLGHVVWVERVTMSGGKAKSIDVTQMACVKGAYGPSPKTGQLVTSYDWYISKVLLDGKSAGLCSDGREVATATDVSKNKVSLFSSELCGTKWVVAKAASSTTKITATSKRRSDSKSVGAAASSAATTTMLEAGTTTVCGAAEFRTSSNKSSTITLACK
jgi:surface antigen